MIKILTFIKKTPYFTTIPVFLFSLYSKYSDFFQINAFLEGYLGTYLTYVVWIVVTLGILWMFFRRSVINDIFFLAQLMGYKRNFHLIYYRYSEFEEIKELIKEEEKVYGRPTWRDEEWRNFYERNNFIAISAIDRERPLGGISIFPIAKECVQEFNDQINKLGATIEDDFDPKYISNYGKKFDLIYVPGIAIIPLRFKYLGIGKIMIKNAVNLFNLKYSEYAEFPLTIYSIATSPVGRFLLKNRFDFTIPNQINPKLQVYRIIFSTKQSYFDYLERHGISSLNTSKSLISQF